MGGCSVRRRRSHAREGGGVEWEGSRWPADGDGGGHERGVGQGEEVPDPVLVDGEPRGERSAQSFVTAGEQQVLHGGEHVTAVDECGGGQVSRPAVTAAGPEQADVDAREGDHRHLVEMLGEMQRPPRRSGDLAGAEVDAGAGCVGSARPDDGLVPGLELPPGVHVAYHDPVQGLAVAALGAKRGRSNTRYRTSVGTGSVRKSRTVPSCASPREFHAFLLMDWPHGQGRSG